MATDTNLDILLELKDTIFVEEILSKTRDGGLPWVKASTTSYQVTMCEPPFCLSPYLEGGDWTFVITKQLVMTEYVYTLDILLSGDNYLQINSRSEDAVSTLFVQIEKTIARHCQIDRAIKFMSNIPTSPSTDVSEFLMCGGAVAAGDSRTFAIYNPALNYGGVSLDGQTSPFLIMTPTLSGGTDADGSHVIQVIFKAQTSGGSQDAGVGDVGVITLRSVSGGSTAGGSAIVQVV